MLHPHRTQPHPSPLPPHRGLLQSPYIISVGSLDADGRLSYFSNFGESAHIAAPGNLVRRRSGCSCSSRRWPAAGSMPHRLPAL